MIALLGASSWLGGGIANRAPFVPISIRDLDLTGPVRLVGAALRQRLCLDGVTDVVNLVGLRRGAPEQLETVNALLPEALALALSGTGIHVIHTGSAAEYGVAESPVLFTEDSACVPTGAYGLTKLRGTLALLAQHDSVTVLRPFNVVGTPLPDDSPLLDVAHRTVHAIDSNTPVRLLSPKTVRDYISRDFVVRAILAAVDLHPTGLFNLCSGLGTETISIARAIVSSLHGSLEVNDFGEERPTWSVGDPSRWASSTGMRQILETSDIAREALLSIGLRQSGESQPW